MKKNFGKIVTALALASVLTVTGGALSACGNKNDPGGDKPPITTEKIITAIQVTLADTFFEKGAVFTTDGMFVEATYDDGSTGFLALADCTISTPDLTTTGKKTLTVTYGELSDSVDVNVFETLKFQARKENGVELDAEWLYESSSSAFGDDKCRYADNNAYFVYRFDAEKGKMFTDARLKVTVSNEYAIAASLDGKTWQTLTEGPTDTGRLQNQVVNLNLKAELTGDQALTQNHGSVYVKFFDADPATGFGCILHDLTFYYDTAADPNPPADEVIRKLEVVTTNKQDTSWIYRDGNSQVWNETEHRYIDENRFVIYGFDFGSALKSAKVLATIKSQYKIEVSADFENWTQIAFNTDKGGDPGNLKFDIEAETLTENDGKLFVKFSDSDPADGFGGSFTKIGVEYVLADDALYTEAVAVADAIASIRVTPPTKLLYNVGDTLSTEGMSVKAVMQSGSERDVALADCEITGFDGSQKGVQTVTIAYSGKITTFTVTVQEVKTLVFGETDITAEDADFIVVNNAGAGEEGSGTKRFADEQNNWVYGINFGAAVTDMSVKMTLKNEYRISVSVDGAVWKEIARNETTNDFGVIARDIRSAIEGNTGKLWFRFADSKPSDGFGIQMTKFELSYVAAGGKTPEKAALPFDDIEITTPTKTEYKLGETLSLAGMTVKTVKGDVKKDMTDLSYLGAKILVNGAQANFNSAGEKTIEIYYLGKIKEFVVNVVAEDVDAGQISFLPNTADESKYFDSQQDVGSGTNPNKHWADENAYYIYKFDKSALGAYVSAKLTIDIENEYKIEFSLDNAAWVTLETAPTGDGNRPARAQKEYDLADKLNANNGVIYIRITDANPADGFGACWYGVTFEYTLAE